MVTRKREYYQETQECLLSDGNFVAKSGKHSLESGDIAWEASTLPLSYTRIRGLCVNSTLKVGENQVVDSLTSENQQW